MGHRARGLQRGRRRLGLPAARPCQEPRLSLGRGRDRRLRRAAAALVPGGGAVERPGPDPEGTVVRPDQRRGQPRRGRQGAVLPPRQHADPLLREDALQVSARGLSLRRAGAGERPARPGPARVRADRHRHLRAEPLLRRVRRVRQGGARRHPDAGARGQPRSRPGAAAPAAAALGAQPLVLDPRRRPAGAARAVRHRRAGAAGRDAGDAPVRRAGRRPAVLRQRHQRPPAVRRGSIGLLQGWHQRPRGGRAGGGGEPGAPRHQVRGPAPTGNPGRRRAGGAAAAACRGRGRPVRRLRRGVRRPHRRGGRLL